MRNERMSKKEDVLHFIKGQNENAGGAVVFYDNNGPVTVNNESNIMFLGVTGSGKSRRGTISMIRSLINAGESFIVTDPKGEIREQSLAYAKDAGYEITTINFRDIAGSSSYNILDLPYKFYTSGDPNKECIAGEMVNTISESIFRFSEHTDPFWIQSARSLFAGATMMLFDMAEKENINIANVINLIDEGTRSRGSETFFKKACSMRPDRSYSTLLRNTNAAPRDTLGSILSSTYEPLMAFMRSDALTDMLNSSGFSISSLEGDTPVAVYIVIPDENTIYSDITGILASQLIEHYIYLAHDKYNGRLPVRLNVVLEELGNIGQAIPNLPQLMSAGRSRNIRTAIVLQSLTQLTDIYGRSKAITIESNCDTLIAYRINHLETLKELSMRCGEREVDYGSRISTEPLITPTQLGAMETGQALIMIAGRIKYVTRLPDFTEIFDTSKNKPLKRTVYRKKQKLTFFDLGKWLQKEEDRHFESLPLPKEMQGEALTTKELCSNEVTRFSKKNPECNTAHIVKVSNYAKLPNLKRFLLECNENRILPVTIATTKPFYVCFERPLLAENFKVRMRCRYKCKYDMLSVTIGDHDSNPGPFFDTSINFPFISGEGELPFDV